MAQAPDPVDDDAIAAELAAKWETARLRDRLLEYEHPTEWFAGHFRHFNLDIPWFHRVWYDAMDDPARRRVFVMGPRLHAKCLVGDTLVLMASGERRRIDSLEPGEEVLGWSGDALEPTVVLGKMSNGVRPVFRLTTRRGRSIVANAEHRFLTWDGWRRLSELAPGDRIASPRRYCIAGDHTEDPAEVKLAAYLISEGTLTGRSPVFTNADPRLLDEFREVATSLGFGVSERRGVRVPTLGLVGRGTVSTWLRVWGLAGRRSGTQVVPDRIFTADLDTQALFLNRLFAGDGTATTGGRGYIGYTSKSRDLAEGIAHLLLRFGISASVAPTKVRGHGTYWLVAMKTAEQVERFLTEVGPIFGREEACSRLSDVKQAGPGWSNDHVDLIPAGWRSLATHGQKWHRLRGVRGVEGHSPTTRRKVEAIAVAERNETLLDIARSAIEWVEVRSIEPEGEAEVWDIETESHTFVANDILTHNTSCALTYALRRLCEDHHLRIGILSQTDELAKHFLAELKHELETNVDLQTRYNGGQPLRGDTWQAHQIVLSDAREGPKGISGKDVSVFSVGRGGQITGYHCDLLIVDDLETKEGTDSDLMRQGTREWWSREVEPVLAAGGKILATGCLARDTPVLMADGTWKRIDSVREGEYVWSVDEAGQAGPRMVEASLDQGIAETLTVRTARTVVTATPWHPFLAVRDGALAWVRADALAVGDFVVETKEIPGTREYGWMTEDFCWLFGYLLGDGWVTSSRLTIACAMGKDEAMNERVVALLRDWFPTVEFWLTPFGYVRGDSRPVARALAAFGLDGKAKTKRVPGWVFRAPPEFRRAFLRGFSAADGHRTSRSADSWVVELANEALIGDLRHLALTSGVRAGATRSRRRWSQPPHSPEPFEAAAWALNLNFATVGGTEYDPKGNIARVADRARFDARAASRLLGAAGRVTRVEAIEVAGSEHVWDLTVEGTHAFVADGMAVHNTRKHFDDIYAYWLAPGSGWDVVDVVKSVYTPEGEPIWPEMWSKELLEIRKASMDQQDLLAWPQEYLNEPRPSDTQMFHPADWPTYPGDPHDFARRNGLAILQFWDLAISEKTTADYTVGWCVGVSDDNDVYILERRRGHWDFNTTLGEIQQMGLLWPGVERIGIEQVAYQAAAVQEALRRSMLPVVPVIPDKDKVTRARLLEARAAALKVIRPEMCPWWSEFATEAIFFPAGAHDDQIDALAGVVRMAGFEALAISWAYNVFVCRNATCKFMFMFEPERPCPKCGRKCPAEYDNPELLSYDPTRKRPLPDDVSIGGAVHD